MVTVKAIVCLSCLTGSWLCAPLARLRFFHLPCGRIEKKNVCTLSLMLFVVYLNYLYKLRET